MKCLCVSNVTDEAGAGSTTVGTPLENRRSPSSCSHCAKCILCTFCEAKGLPRQVAARYHL